MDPAVPAEDMVQPGSPAYKLPRTLVSRDGLFAGQVSIERQREISEKQRVQSSDVTRQILCKASSPDTGGLQGLCFFLPKKKVPRGQWGKWICDITHSQRRRQGFFPLQLLPNIAIRPMKGIPPTSMCRRPTRPDRRRAPTRAPSRPTTPNSCSKRSRTAYPP